MRLLSNLTRKYSYHKSLTRPGAWSHSSRFRANRNRLTNVYKIEPEVTTTDKSLIMPASGNIPIFKRELSSVGAARKLSQWLSVLG